MSIFSAILDRLKGHRTTSPAPAAAANPSAAASAAATPHANASSGNTPTAAAEPVDVEAIMTDLERKRGHKSNGGKVPASLLT